MSTDAELIADIREIKTDIKHIREDTMEIKATNEKQWEAINRVRDTATTNSVNIKNIQGRFNQHLITPHCGEDDKEIKEASKAIVTLIKFFKSKQGKGTGIIGLIIAALLAAQQLGWL